MSASISFQNLGQIQARYSKLEQAKGVAEAVNRAALEVEGQARALAPVDTGALANSITMKPATANSGEITAEVYTDKEYAAFVEYGTGQRGAATAQSQPLNGSIAYGDNAGQVAQPYMKPALEQVRKRYASMMSAKIKS